MLTNILYAKPNSWLLSWLSRCNLIRMSSESKQFEQPRATFVRTVRDNYNLVAQIRVNNNVPTRH